VYEQATNSSHHGLVLVTAAGLLAYVTRQRKDPSACPYGLRFFLDVPHPFVTRSRLREILAPEPAQRVLEVGPGTGYYSLHALPGGWSQTAPSKS
jgi:hypothetical protein